LRIHLCTQGNVIATASVDFGPLIAFQKEEVKVVNEYNFKPRVKDLEQTSSCARVAVTLSLDKSSVATFLATNQQQKQQHLLPSKSTMVQATSVQKEPSPKQSKEEETVKAQVKQETAKEETESKRCSNVDNDDAHRRREAQLQEKEAKLQMRYDQLSKKEQQLYESLATLEKRRLEWEQSKHQEELTWQEKLRSKEAEMMSTIEERITQNEKERLSSIDKTRSEYEQLEKRLTKAIVEVEAKDRAQKELQESHQHEYNRKLAELELREKLVKKEMKHTVEIEVSIYTARFV
jgi:DNA repair exonuclease SbcCD ATPase subunit